MKMRAALLGAAAVMGMAPAAFAERGTDGEVKLTFPQAVSIMNPYLSGGTKDIYASSMVLEPLAGLDPQGNLVPKMAAEIPTRENGGISEDLFPAVRATGVGSVAVVRALVNAPDPEAAAQHLLQRMQVPA